MRQSPSAVGKLRLLRCYFRILKNSFSVQRLKSRKPESENILGYSISFGTYGELIDLYESIFLRNDYHFKSQKSAPSVVDIGSNIGMSILFFKMIYPDCRIEAFEPHPETFRLLERNVRVNNLRGVTLHQMAVGNMDSTASLYHDDKISGTLTATLKPVKKDLQQTPVKILHASTVIHEAIDLLKLDVEGSEDDILNDLHNNGKLAFIQEIVMELHPKQIDQKETSFMSFLTEVFEQTSIRNSRYSENTIVRLLKK